MKNCDMDERLAEHIAKMFSRDPIPTYEGEFIEDQINDNDITMHFENIQSTNWNSMRFKPPPS
jgi:glutamate--cysteine ligase catalytic subunit